MVVKKHLRANAHIRITGSSIDDLKKYLLRKNRHESRFIKLREKILSNQLHSIKYNDLES